MNRFSSTSSFVTSVMRGRRMAEKPFTRKDVAEALMEAQHERPAQYYTNREDNLSPTAKNVLDRTR